MKQLFQNNRTGKIEVVELPAPAVQPGCLLVRNHCSVVSPGTERSTVSASRDSYLKTARNRPDLVKRVVDLVKKDGVMSAYQKVRLKLSEPKALGYSTAGEVIAVGPGAGDYFRVGDRVACGGQGVASHAEVISVPVNLAAKLPDAVGYESAAFTTLGSIALQGVRLGEPTLGERWAVIGLGLVGMLSVQLLRAHGARVAAFDLQGDLVEMAKGLGAELAVAGGTGEQVAAALAWSEGMGVDGVLVCAASSSEAPMLAAGGMARDRARIVAVGAVPFGLPREVAFAKELQLLISRSYGPGRYDRDFEEKGVDYPVGYVRWTETRNFEAFVHLLSTGQVDTAPLITHRFPVEQGPQGYDLLMEGEERVLGMVLSYPERAVPQATFTVPSRPAPGPIRGDIGVSFIGAGAFARGTLLPRFSQHKNVKMRLVSTSRGLSALDAMRSFGFADAAAEADQVLADDKTHVVCIATRHDSHADLVVRALQAGKHVFVEKPLALNETELQRVEAALAETRGLLMVGFNRRFAPMAQQLRGAIAARGPSMIDIRVNAGNLGNHWLLDPEVGGGRIIGEGCHFVDLASYFAGDAPIASLQAQACGNAHGPAQDVQMLLRFDNGATAHILYTSLGNGGLGKERVELFCGGAAGVIDDWNKGGMHGARPEKFSGSGKGHAEEVDAFLEAVKKGGPPPIAHEVLVRVTRATFQVHEALHEQGQRPVR